MLCRIFSNIIPFLCKKGVVALAEKLSDFWVRQHFGKWDALQPITCKGGK